MKSNEELQHDIETYLASLPEEERQAILAADDAMDRLMCLKLGRELQATIETIPNDRHHIRVDGQVMGYNEFAEWKANREAELHPDEEYDDEYDDDYDDEYDEDDDDCCEDNPYRSILFA